MPLGIHEKPLRHRTATTFVGLKHFLATFDRTPNCTLKDYNMNRFYEGRPDPSLGEVWGAEPPEIKGKAWGRQAPKGDLGGGSPKNKAEGLSGASPQEAS